jgi:hypothetical protein
MVRDGQTARRTPADGCHFNARRLERVQGRVEGPFLNAEDILRGPMDGVGDRRNPCMSSPSRKVWRISISRVPGTPNRLRWLDP